MLTCRYLAALSTAHPNALGGGRQKLSTVKSSCPNAGSKMKRSRGFAATKTTSTARGRPGGDIIDGMRMHVTGVRKRAALLLVIGYLSRASRLRFSHRAYFAARRACYQREHASRS